MTFLRLLCIMMKCGLENKCYVLLDLSCIVNNAQSKEFQMLSQSLNLTSWGYAPQIDYGVQFKARII